MLAPSGEHGDADARLAELRWAHPFVPRGVRDIVAVLPGAAGDRLGERLEPESYRVRDDLIGSSNRQGGSGGQMGRFLELGDEFLKANLSRRYASIDQALACEKEPELLRQRLGIYHPDRVWFLSRGADSAFWACSLTPRLPLLRALFNSRAEPCDERRAWSLYLSAFRMSFELARHESVLLDCNPNNFALDGTRLYYVDDDLGREGGRMPFGHQALLRLREYAHAELGLRVEFLEGFLDLAEGYLGDARLREGLRGDLEQDFTWPLEPELRSILTRLVALLSVAPRGPR